VTGEEFKKILYENQLRQIDVAWFCDVHFRQVRAWCNGRYPVPQCAMLLVLALEEGLITPRWLARKLKTKPLALTPQKRAK